MGLIKWFDEGHNEKWHKLMTDQIYTAVLGSIIYLIFEWLYLVLNNADKIHFEDGLIKTLILTICIVFYLCDYYYIKWTNPYRKWYFFLDLVFMGCMFFTVKSLGLEFKDDKTTLLNIQFESIVIAFGIFYILYLVWDCRELSASKTVELKNYYKEVIVWEIISIILLLLNWFFHNIYLLIVCLFISTIWFVFITIRKEKHISSKFINLFFN